MKKKLHNVNKTPNIKPKFSDKLILMDLVKYYRMGLEPSQMYQTVAREREQSAEYLRRKFTLQEIRESVRELHQLKQRA